MLNDHIEIKINESWKNNFKKFAKNENFEKKILMLDNYFSHDMVLTNYLRVK